MSGGRADGPRVNAATVRSAKGGAGADRLGAMLWIAIGSAIAVGAWRMDRLERMQIKPWEVPGLVPGLLGVSLALLGLALLLRARPDAAAVSGSAGARGDAVPDAAQAPVAGPGRGARRTALALVLGLVYALVLVGHGLPFWLATAIFVATFVGLLDGARQRTLGRSSRAVALRALGFGLVVGIAVHLVFEQVFLVRLP